MENSPVHEHGREDRQCWMDRLDFVKSQDVLWNGAVSIGDLFHAVRRRNFIQKYKHIQHDNTDGNIGNSARRVIIFVGDQFLLPPISVKVVLLDILSLPYPYLLAKYI